MLNNKFPGWDYFSLIHRQSAAGGSFSRIPSEKLARLTDGAYTPNSLKHLFTLGFLDEFEIGIKPIIEQNDIDSPANEHEERWRFALAVTILYGEMSIEAKSETIDFSSIDLEDKGVPLFLRIIKKCLPKRYGPEIKIMLARSVDGEFEPFAYSSPYIVNPTKEMNIAVRNDKDCPFALVGQKRNRIDVPMTLLARVADSVSGMKPLLKVLIHALEAALECAEFSQAHFLIKRFLKKLHGADYGAYDKYRRIAGKPLVVISGYEPFIPFDRESVFTEKICFLNENDEEDEFCMFKSCYGNYGASEIVSGKANNGGKYDVNNSAKKYSALLPFTKEFIEKHLSDEKGAPLECAKTLNPSISIIATATDSVTATTSDSATASDFATVSSTAAYFFIKLYINNEFIYLSNKYSSENFLIKPGSGQDAILPGVAVWPDKTDPLDDWNEYYIFQSEDNSNEKNLCKGLWFDLSAKYDIKNINGSDKGFVTGQKGNLFKTYQINRFPSFLYAELNNEYCGAVILSPRGEIDKFRNKHIAVGMDFGTTSSAAYIAEIPDNEVEWLNPNKLDFIDNSVLWAVSPKILRDYGRNAFIPGLPLGRKEDNDFAFSFFTVLHLFDLKAETSLIDSNNLFVGAETLEYPDFGNVPDNIKWNEEDSSYADLFIEQFVKMCAWKSLERGAKKISFRLSFPSSLTSADAFEKRVEGALKKLSFRHQELSTTTESRAATLYFHIDKV